jgi:2-dehydro-3-deoxy-D-gluconate 5-dehydrogenase
VGDSAYATSKAGVIHFTRALALEWAHFGIRVNAISPGAFWTDMWAVPTAGLSDEQRERLRRNVEADVPMERWGALRDLGLAAVFLASAASSYVTGENLHVDGGIVAR